MRLRSGPIGGLVIAGFLLTWGLDWLHLHPRPLPAPALVTDAVPLRPGLSPDDHLTAHLVPGHLGRAILAYSDLTGRQLWPDTRPVLQKLDRPLGGRLLRLGLYTPAPKPDSGLTLHADGLWRADEVKEQLEDIFFSAGLKPVPRGKFYFELVKR